MITVLDAETLQITPAHAPLSGTVRVPGDKSISHRSVLFGALADGTTHIDGWLPAVDCRATVACVRSLGVEVEIDESDPTRVTVHGRGMGALEEPADVLDCDGSGTTMRLIAGLLAGLPFYSVLTGRDALRRRPMGRITGPLRSMGARVLGREGGNLAPLSIKGGDLSGIDYRLPVASAQVKSALLLAGLSATGTTTIHEPGPARDHTERMLSAMGASISVDGRTLTVRQSGGDLTPLRGDDGGPFRVPADISSAAFLIVACMLVPDSTIRLLAVGTNPTRTGIIELLRDMGADLSVDNVHDAAIEPTADLLVSHSTLRGVEIAGDVVVRAIDEFPILAVAATQAEGTTSVRGAEELRVKETDRIGMVAHELSKMGAKVEPRGDGFVVRGPTPLHGADVDSHGDHRLAMALAVAGLIADGTTTLNNAHVIADSFPSFSELLTELQTEA